MRTTTKQNVTNKTKNKIDRLLPDLDARVQQGGKIARNLAK